MMARLATLIVTLLLAVGAQAETYPARSVRLLVPYPAGGAVDILGRLLGQQLSVYWDQPVVIDNRPGAGGVIATDLLAKAPSDGYTLLLVASGHSVNPAMYGKLPYDTFKDFTAISEVGWAPNIVLANLSTPAKTLGRAAGAGARRAGQAELRHAGLWHLAASVRRAAQIHGQGRHRRGAL
ncbi:MAG: tripartite tricarboxylate transporter substrate-binding protein [Pseudomonadota bacterium]